MASAAFKSATKRSVISGGTEDAGSSNRAGVHRRSRSLSRYSGRFPPSETVDSDEFAEPPRGGSVNTISGSGFPEISLDDLADEFFPAKDVDGEESGKVDGRLGCRLSDFRSRMETESSKRRGRSVSRKGDFENNSTSKGVSDVIPRRRRSISVARCRSNNSESEMNSSCNSHTQSGQMTLSNGNCQQLSKKSTTFNPVLRKSSSQKDLSHDSYMVEESTKESNVSLECVMDYTGEFMTHEIFKSRDELIKWTRDVAKRNGFIVVIKGSDSGSDGKKPRINFACERGGKYRSCGEKSQHKAYKRPRSTGTKKCECPFALKGLYMPEDEWMLNVVCGVHNHPLTEYLKGRSYAGKLSEAETSLLMDMSDNLVKPKFILSTLKDKNPLNLSTMKTIYNARHRHKVAKATGRPQMQHVMDVVPPRTLNVPSCEYEVDSLLKCLNDMNESSRLQCIRKIRDLANSETGSLLEPEVLAKARPDPSVFELIESGHDSCYSPVGIVTSGALPLPKPQSRKTTKKHAKATKLMVRRNKPSKHGLDFYIDQFPIGMKPHISYFVDVVPDGNCGFRALAALLGYGEDGWSHVRKDLLGELNSLPDFYSRLYGGQERFDELARRLTFFDTPAPIEFWLIMPEMGFLISSRYHVVLFYLSMRLSLTFLPFRSPPVPIQFRKEIALGFINGNHFVQLVLVPGHPIPPIAAHWERYREDCAIGWDDAYISHIERYREIIGHDIETIETSYSSTVTDDEGLDVHKNGAEKTIRAVYSQKKTQHPVGDGEGPRLYEAMRKEVRHAVEEIRTELEKVIVKSKPSMIANGADLQSNGSDTVQAIAEMRRTYTTKLEESEKRKQELLAELAAEEERGQELTKIVKELLPGQKRTAASERPLHRRRSNDKNRMSKRLTEEAKKYFEDFISNVEDTDISSFDGERSDTSSTVGGSVKSKDPVMSAASETRGCLSKAVSLPVETDGVALPWLEWETSNDSTSPHRKSKMEVPVVPRNNILGEAPEVSSPHCGNSYFTSSRGSWSPDGNYSSSMVSRVKTGPGFEEVGSSNIHSRAANSSKKSPFDMDDYVYLQHGEDLLFECFRQRQRIETGSLVLCGRSFS